jgi:hypothetical protein
VRSLTTKILALIDALGNIARFVLMPGYRFKTVGVAPPRHRVPVLIADEAFDRAGRTPREDRYLAASAPRKTNRNPRRLIENNWCKLKEFKRIAMRSDKTDHSFATMVYLPAAVINLR